MSDHAATNPQYQWNDDARQVDRSIQDADRNSHVLLADIRLVIIGLSSRVPSFFCTISSSSTCLAKQTVFDQRRQFFPKCFDWGGMSREALNRKVSGSLSEGFTKCFYQLGWRNNTKARLGGFRQFHGAAG
jgi:hypothetical protein